MPRAFGGFTSDMSSSTVRERRDNAHKMDEFRSTLRIYASEVKKTVQSLLIALFKAQVSGDEKEEVRVTKDVFGQKMSSIRNIRQKFSPKDVMEIYDEAEYELDSEMTSSAVIEFFSNSISRVRSLALKMRAAIKQDFNGVHEYRNAFFSIVQGDTHYAELDAFTDFAEDMLDVQEGSMSDGDAAALYAIVDKDADGKVSLNDFLEFVVGQSIKAIKGLNGYGSDDMIIDLLGSDSPDLDAELERTGYKRVIPEGGVPAGGDPSTYGSFGKGQSLWCWRKKQGDASGRLKPIIDIHLEKAATSSAMVLSGYTALRVRIGGFTVWIKRATDEEEAKRAIVDLRVTVGTTKAGDKALTSPGGGVGWNRIEGNFAHSMLSSSGAFLWAKPMQSHIGKGSHKALHHLLNGAKALTGHGRQANVMNQLRIALRNYVPAVTMANIKTSSTAVPSGDAAGGGGAEETKAGGRSDRDYDFTNLFLMYSGQKRSMSASAFHNILHDVGIRLDKVDEVLCYGHLDCKQDGNVDRNDFARILVLTDYDLDIVIDGIREALLRERGVDQSSTRTNPMRVSRILGHIFKHINFNGDHVLSVEEFGYMASKLGFFLVNEEIQRIMALFDVGGDGRVEEADFIRFLKARSDSNQRKAQRVFDYSARLKQWLRNGAEPGDKGAESQWAVLMKRKKRFTGTFPGYIGPEDLLLLMASAMDIRMSYQEAAELTLLVAPTKGGRVQEEDIYSFMVNQSRTIGEVMAIIERDVMKTVIDSYRSHRGIVRADGQQDVELAEKYQKETSKILTRIAASSNVTVGPNSKQSKPSGQTSEAEAAAQYEIVSLAQLKAGVEAAMGRPPSHGTLPNLEEWGILAINAGAARFEDDVYGAHAKVFIAEICHLTAGHLEYSSEGETASLDSVCTDLRFMINDEAARASNGRGKDYVAVFSSFDTDGSGAISVDEMVIRLKKMQLIDRLPLKLVPELMKVFDRHNTGSINFDDFLHFAESGERLDDALDDEDEEEVEVGVGLASNLPPAKITNNPDCDWLVWFLYRSACRIGRKDPEMVISDLEVNSRNAEINSPDKGIPAGKLWKLLTDSKLVGNMRKSQFDKGVYFLALDGDGSQESDPIDYLSLCKYITRMGFAYNALIQKRRNVDVKKFSSLLSSLKKALINLDNSTASLMPSPSAKSGGNAALAVGSYFERIMRRQDSNSDGLLTVPEFANSLKRMQNVDARGWSKAMVRKLFEECGNRSDGLLNIIDFGKMVRGDYSSSSAPVNGAWSRKDERGADKSLAGLSDDEDDNIFSLQKMTTDTTLMKKVSNIMMDLVPMSRAGGSPNSIAGHVDAIRSVIYKYFHRFDPAGKGTVVEEHFAKFAQKSGLKTRLRAAELRKLTSKLRVRSNEGMTATIDYEKLCRMLSPPSDSFPRSRVDAVVHHLQEAAKVSAMSGRSFVTLCSLADPRLSGRITSEEFCIVCKMMGYPLSMSDLDMFKEALKESLGDKYHGTGDMIDYNDADHFLTAYVPGAQLSMTTYDGGASSGLYEQSVHRVRHRDENGSLPAYASPGTVTRMPFSPGGTGSFDTRRTVRTAGGQYIASPMYLASATPGRSSMSMTTPVAAAGTPERLLYGGSVEDRALSALANRIANSRYALRLNHPAMVSILRQCEDKDVANSGYLHESELQHIFDEIDIVLTPPDLRAIRSKYRRSVVDDSIDYRSLCYLLRQMVDQANTSPLGHSATSTFLQSPAIARKLSTFRADGVNIRKAFEDCDFDRSGTIDAIRFGDIVRRFGILQSERQLGIAIAEYTCLSDRSKVSYEDFCDTLDASEKARSTEFGHGFGNTAKSIGSVDASGYDGVRGRASRDGRFTSSELDGRPPYGAPAHLGRTAAREGDCIADERVSRSFHVPSNTKE